MKGFVLLCASLLIAGCVSQNELALSKNVYKLDVDSRGLIARHEAKTSIQRRAAELTLSRGFTHYIIADASTSEGARYLGRTPVYGNTTINMMGNTGFATTNVYGGQPIIQPRSSTSLIVVMFNEREAPAHALDARALAKPAKP